MLKVERGTTASAGKGVQKRTVSLLVGLQSGKTNLENSLVDSYKMKYMTYDPAIPLLGLGVYPDETKPCVPPKTYTQTFTPALFVIAPNWKPPRVCAIE